jgi:hypothetical protein
MRTRLAILLAAVAGLVFAASTVMTNHLGMRDWPTAPAPDTATRVITPSEAAGRAADPARGGDAPDVAAERAQRVDADGGMGDDDAARGGTAPVRSNDRTGRRAPRRDGRSTSRPAPSTEPADSQTQGPHQLSQPATTPVPAAPADPPADDQHTREDDLSAPQPAPAPTLESPEIGAPAPAPDTDSATPDGDGPGDRRSGPLRHLLDALR